MDENQEKRENDRLASTLLRIDDRSQDRIAKTIAEVIPFKVPKLMLSGAAGANKSTVGKKLSDRLGVPVFDFDDYITGGWDINNGVYRKRLLDALYELWNQMPSKGGWILEHVEACNPMLLDTLKPNVAILLKPGLHHVQEVAKARDIASGATDPIRQYRATQSGIRAASNFMNIDHRKIHLGEGWTLKTLVDS